MGANYTVFVHFVDASGNILFQDDHQPPTATSTWSGAVSYTRSVTVPSTVAARLPMRSRWVFYPPTNYTGALPLAVGSGVIALGGNYYQTGVLKVVVPATAISGACGASNGTDLTSAPTTRPLRRGHGLVGERQRPMDLELHGQQWWQHGCVFSPACIQFKLSGSHKCNSIHDLLDNFIRCCWRWRDEQCDRDPEHVQLCRGP